MSLCNVVKSESNISWFTIESMSIFVVFSSIVVTNHLSTCINRLKNVKIILMKKNLFGIYHFQIVLEIFVCVSHCKF